MRTTPLKRKSSKPSKRQTIDREIRNAVFARAEGICDMCGLGLSKGDWECHHRKLRSQGGPDTMSNLIALDQRCHTRAHGNPDWAKENGFIVPPWRDPENWPVNRYLRVWQQPTDRGWVDAEPHEDQAEEAA